MFVSLTVSDIFSVKEERDLESGVRGSSRSLNNRDLEKGH